MNTHDIDIELPAEFRSGNDIPVTQATIKRERMEEVIRDAIEADRKRRGEPSSLAEVWRINADEAEAYGQSDRADTLRECAAAVERLAAPQPAQRALITGKQLPDGSYEAVPAESVETLKVPSIDEIMDAVWAYGCAHGMRKVTATEFVTRWRDIRALLARYGNAALPADGEEIIVSLPDGRRYPLPLLPTGMGAPRYRVEVPAPQPAGAAHE